MFSGLDLIAYLLIIDPNFITFDGIGKLLFVMSCKDLATLTHCLFCSLVNRCGTYITEIFQTFKYFFKISRTVDSDMTALRAISRTVNLASHSMIYVIVETIYLRDFGLPNFGAFLMDSTPD